MTKAPKIEKIAHMIGFLQGKVIHADTASAVLLCGQIGYTLYPVGCVLLKDQEIECWIHDVVREDRRDLYAFADLASKTLFEQLITIDGVGQKLAQKILNSADAESLRRNILNGDITFLTSLSGVGKKTAQKIILEMKGVLVETDQTGSTVSGEVIDGLRSLGYSLQDIKPYLHDLPEDTATALKEILRRFASHKNR